MNLRFNDNGSSATAVATPRDELVDAHAEHACNDRQGNLMRLAGWIDLDSKLTVCYPLPQL